jgi:Raf kinase inhibitor-like YbhB/YbcL family protein
MTEAHTGRPGAELRLASPAFAPGAPIPRDHTCEGDDRSPPLGWSGAPAETRSFAVICTDPDAPRGVWVHWLLYDLPSDCAELAPGVPAGPELPSGARQGRNGWGGVGYRGPCPPPGDPHRYAFRVLALDTLLRLPPGAEHAEVEHAAAGHVLAEGTLVGTYGRRRGA